MEYDDFLDLDPGEVSTFNVKVVADTCGNQAAWDTKGQRLSKDNAAIGALYVAKNRGAITEKEYGQNLANIESATEAAARRSARDVTVGTKVRVELSAPLFDGTIAPVVDDIQTFNSGNDAGHWEWQLKPNSPGNFSLPLRLTVYDNDGKEVLKENEILSVRVHVPWTFGYTVSLLWTAIGNFFSSLQGLIASMAAVFGGSAGFRAWLVRKSKKAVKVVTATTPAASVNGYL